MSLTFFRTNHAPERFSTRKLRPSQGAKAKNQILRRGRRPKGIKFGGELIIGGRNQDWGTRAHPKVYNSTPMPDLT